jgi:stage III sporulation protein AF
MGGRGVEFIKQWLQQLMIILVMAAFFDMLIPRNSMHKYIKLVISLCILLTLLMPIVRLVGGEAKEWLYSQTEKQFTEATARASPGFDANPVASVYSQQTRSLIERNMAAQISAKLHSMLTKPMDCKVQAEFVGETIRAIRHLDCSPGSPQFAETQIKVSEIQAIHIESSDDTKRQNENSVLENRIVQYVREQWQMELESLDIETEGGENRQ